MSGFYKRRRVFLTGHTGFKGSWLSEWLLMLGARVTGYALAAPTDLALFIQLGLANRLQHFEGDVRNLEYLEKALIAAQPEVVFHLAAQPLVRLSYAEPVETYATNVMGTINLLEAVRRSGLACTVVIITTDKCYENREWHHGYREEDPLGGYDPYSSSKAMAEIATAAYRRSFFQKNGGVLLASARAGNVIGGGDWALDRIVPDSIRALSKGEPVLVRNKTATRPWQHVLEPLSGYLLLAEKLSAGQDPALNGAFNFGPHLASNRTVAGLVVELLKHWEGRWIDRGDLNAPHEAGKLNLATDKAFHHLGWQPRWDFETTIEKTAAWYRSVHQGGDPLELTQRQIREYEAGINSPLGHGGTEQNC